MARKKLLSEGEIRQFMKLANLRPLAAKRLSEYSDMSGTRDEDEHLSSELHATEDELGKEDHVADEESDELAAMDDAAPAGGNMVSMDDFMAALEVAIEDVTGEEAEVSADPGEEELEVADVDMVGMGPDGAEMEVSAEDEMVAEIVRRVAEAIDLRKSPDNPLAAGTPARRQKYGGNPGDIPAADRKKKGHYGRGGKTKETAKEEGEGDYGEVAEEKIVAEVAKRVARRLQRENQKDQMADQLAERIMKRLTK
tara:strand:- start:253 stop:1014 length:762 start_codon:yes stop_codon:yes gene_type:complete